MPWPAWVSSSTMAAEAPVTSPLEFMIGIEVTETRNLSCEP